MRNSKIILAHNVPLKKDYKIISLVSSADFLTYLRSESHLLVERDDFSFIRNKGSINVSVSYPLAISCTYIAWQNTDYYNKWFFAFVDKVEYVSENACEITYTLDIFRTYADDIRINSSLVVREHVSDDTIGTNTLEENVALGDFVTNSVDSVSMTPYAYIVHATEKMDGTYAGVIDMNGILQVGVMYATLSKLSYQNIISAYQNGREDAIISCYMVPYFTLNHEITGTDVYEIDNVAYPGQFIKNVTTSSSLDTYIPRNNKLLTYPYNYIVMDNNNGTSNILEYERFNKNIDGDIEFHIIGVPSLGASVKCEPVNYKGVQYNELESIPLGKYPTLAWINDTYINWLTLNGNNLAYGRFTGAISLGTGLLTGNILATLYGADKLIRGQNEMWSHEMLPNTASGNTNCGDIVTAKGQNKFIFYKMSITRSKASEIDSYFDLYGYRVNSVKIPNINTRPYFNYVEIDNSTDCICGDIPSNYLDEMNAIFHRGVFIWKSLSNFGDFSLAGLNH